MSVTREELFNVKLSRRERLLLATAAKDETMSDIARRGILNEARRVLDERAETVD